MNYEDLRKAKEEACYREAQAQKMNPHAAIAQGVVNACDEEARPNPRASLWNRMSDLAADKEALEHLMAHLPDVYWNSPLAHRLWSRLLP